MIRQHIVMLFVTEDFPYDPDVVRILMADYLVRAIPESRTHVMRLEEYDRENPLHFDIVNNSHSMGDGGSL